MAEGRGQEVEWEPVLRAYTQTTPLVWSDFPVAYKRLKRVARFLSSALLCLTIKRYTSFVLLTIWKNVLHQ